MKKKFILGITLLFYIYMFFVIINRAKPINDFTKVNYNTDVSIIKSRFVLFKDIRSVYWKYSYTNKNNRVGLNEFYIKGFILLDKETYYNIIQNYEWKSCHLKFDDGIDPNVTGNSTFEWFSSDHFSKNLLKNDYMGAFYLDKINKVIYFDLSTY